MPTFSPERGYLKKFFEKYNTNGDEFLDKKEINRAFKDLGALFPSWRAGRSLRYADTDKNGLIDHEELEALVDYVIKRGFDLNKLLN